MKALRLGSYSMVLTVAGTSSFWRLKSMMRYLVRLPPPWCRTVILPVLLRPLCFFMGSSRLRSGATLDRTL